MSTVAAKARVFFQPLQEVVAPVSVRSWMLLILGTSFAALVRPYLAVSVQAMALLSLPLAAACIGSVGADYARARSGTWTTATALTWVLGLMVLSMLRVPAYRYHDELLLTKVALTGIDQGINPYRRDFRGTEFDAWIGNATQDSWINGRHPAATTYVYLPGHLLQSMLFYQLTTRLFHWYDQRLVYIVALAAVLAMLWRALRRSPVREPLLLLFTFSPFMAMNFYGINEWTMLAWLLASALLFVYDRSYAAAAALGVALATKQLSAFAVVFFLPLLFVRISRSRGSPIVAVGVLALVAVAVVAPFVVWSPRDFAVDTLGFFTRDVTYPIAGEGVGGLLLKIGAVGPADPFPFWIFQILFTAPLLVAIGWWLLHNQTVRNTLLATALAFAAVGFFWRYFLPAHVNVAVIIGMLAFLVGEAERTRQRP